MKNILLIICFIIIILIIFNLNSDNDNNAIDKSSSNTTPVKRVRFSKNLEQIRYIPPNN